MLDKLLNLWSVACGAERHRTVSNLAMKLLLNLQRRGVIESDFAGEEYEHLGLVIQLKSVELNTKVNWCVYVACGRVAHRLKQGVSYNTKTALSHAIKWIDNLDPNDPTQFD